MNRLVVLACALLSVLLSAVAVAPRTALAARAHRSTHVVVAIGDSITYGKGATDVGTRGWVPLLGQRAHCTTIDAGVVGNSLVTPESSGLIPARFGRDVLDSHAGVVLLGGGRNDLGKVASWRDIAQAELGLARRARAAGLDWWIETVTPTARPDGAAADHSDPGEVQRLALNAFYRREVPPDHLLDFDRVLSGPDGWLPGADSADGLHLSDEADSALATYVAARHVCT